MGGRWAGQRNVKKVGVVVNLYNRFMASKNGLKKKIIRSPIFLKGLKQHSHIIALKEWF